MPVSRRGSFPHFLALLFFFFAGLAPAGAWAQTTEDWKTPARSLAGKILSAAGARGKISLLVVNASSLSGEEISAASGALRAALGGLGFAFASPAEMDVRVTLSENLREYLWIAEVSKGGTPRVRMVTIRKPEFSPGVGSLPPLFLTSQIVWRQPERIIDWTFSRSSSPASQRLLILEPERLAIYRLADHSWLPEDSFPIPHANPWPRDLRGRLLVDENRQIEIFLPDVHCLGTLASAALQCRQEEALWPIGARDAGEAAYVADRNYFETLPASSMAAGTKSPSFYAAAPLSRPKGLAWVLAETNGTTGLYESPAVPLLPFSSWGSEVASLDAGCGGTDSLLAATAASDWTQADRVQVYEIHGEAPEAIGSPLDFPGPVMSLWRDAEGRSANLVVRELKTGMYEAFTLRIVCKN